MLAALPCLFETTQCKRSKSTVAKKAETLFMNLEGLIKRRGLDCIGFLTMTFAENLKCRVEAQRRFNSFATNFLRNEVLEYVAAVERQSRGAIHYHLVCAFPYDIRTGFDFAACTAANNARRAGNLALQRENERVYVASANDNLRRWWRTLGSQKVAGAARGYGFGRCETLPVLSNSEGLARYVGAYVGCELSARQARDKGLRTIRYSLDERVASIRWQWADGAGRVWRLGCAVLSFILGTDDFTGVLGNRWSWNFRNEISVFGRHFDTCMEVLNTKGVSDNKDFPERVAVVSRLAGKLMELEKDLPTMATT